MRRLVVLALVAVSCASSLEREYEEGALTPFARDALSGEASMALAVGLDEATDGTDAKMKEVEQELERLAAEWRARARPQPGRPTALGFIVQSHPL